MFLRNYDNVIALMLTADYYSKSYTNAIDEGYYMATSPTDFADGELNIKTPNGSLTSDFYLTCHYSSGSTAISPIALLNFHEKGICLGNGSEPVTYDDYKLSGDVVANELVRLSRERSWDSENMKWIVTLACIYSNTGSTDITISEWGIFRGCGSENNTTYSNSSSTALLIYREVLDEPIVIEAGTTATLTFSVDIPMPNHP